jgi:hypothetical protein
MADTLQGTEVKPRDQRQFSPDCTLRRGFTEPLVRGRTLAIAIARVEKGDFMRKALFVGLSALMVGAVFAAPASAQGPSAGGSCGYRAGEYGIDNLSPLDIRNPNRGGMNVGTIHTQVEYSGVQPGTRLTIISSVASTVTGMDLGATGAVRNVTAQGTSGTVSFSVSQNENGAERQNRLRGLASNKGHGKQGGTSSAGQSNGANNYMFQVWADGNVIGTFTCGVSDA